jgi:23S rRNA pseudouridine1911/1915/1917 synthase
VGLLERTAGAEDEGRRVDVVLSDWLAEPRSRTQERLLAGEVTVDLRPVAKSHRVRAGERFAVAAPAVVEDPTEALPEVPVRWRDEHLAVVAKPAGLVVHDGAGVRGSATLVAALQAAGLPLSRAGDPQRPGIVHRLDRGTSGLLVVALSDDAFLGLTALLREHDVEREYRAIVDGVPAAASATVDAPIARDPAQRTRFAVTPAGDPSARSAVTHYDVVEAFGRAALLEVRLETGRTHQVRVHLSAIGHPVVGDATYGASPVLTAELGLSRPALHARGLAFVHPVTGERVDVREPDPDDLAAALARLRHPGP